MVVPSLASEIALSPRMDGDGKPEVVFSTGGDGARVRQAPIPPIPPASGMCTRVSDKIENVNPHGIGVGDINGDGRMDIVSPRRLVGAAAQRQPARRPGNSIPVTSAAAAPRCPSTT